VDLRLRRLLDRIALPAGSGATGVAVVNDSIAYVGNPNLNTVSRVNYLAGTTVEVPVGPHPQGVVFTRGRVFVLNGNVDAVGAPLGPSWITVLDPATNAPASGVDSIALTGGRGRIRDGRRGRPALRRQPGERGPGRGAPLRRGSAGPNGAGELRRPRLQTG
jgi:hypothetical protein